MNTFLNPRAQSFTPINNLMIIILAGVSLSSESETNIYWKKKLHLANSSEARL